MNRSTLLEFEIWCHVVDNYGDAGVCWRLARQLAGELGQHVTLRIDHLPTLAAIEPRVRAGQVVDGVRVALWSDARPAPGGAGAGVVVSAFGCELPAGVRQRIADPARPTLWVNLEYLSAEPWVEGCHRLSSIKPADGAVEHFFYPGFTAATGGVLRERGLLERRDAFRAGGGPRAWLAAHGAPGHPGEFTVSMFCYPDAPLAELCQLLAAMPVPVRLMLARGVDARVPAGIDAGSTLRVTRLPWLTQDDYDRLLWSCDLNFVRGEDSWVRAQWAGTPFVWQPYRQDDGAHRVKLDAFLARLAGGTDDSSAGADPARAGAAGAAGAADAVGALMRAWSGVGELAGAWRRHQADFEAVRALHRRWTAHLADQADLASSLVEFCGNKL